MHSIVEDARHDASAPHGSNVWKIGTFYGTYMDCASIEAAGLKPLELDAAGQKNASRAIAWPDTPFV